MRTVPGGDWNGSALIEPEGPSEEAGSTVTEKTPLCASFALNDHPLLEDVIPQIYHLAQHVGGLERLAEIVLELQRSQPE